MNHKNLTPVFPPEIKPTIPGVYMSGLSFTTSFYNYWDGEFWYVVATTPKYARKHFEQGNHASNQSRFWRGLAQEPTA